MPAKGRNRRAQGEAAAVRGPRPPHQGRQLLGDAGMEMGTLSVCGAGIRQEGGPLGRQGRGRAEVTRRTQQRSYRGECPPQSLTQGWDPRSTAVLSPGTQPRTGASRSSPSPGF